MKKKYVATSKDKKDWMDFTKNMSGIFPKEEDFFKKTTDRKMMPKLDLHGFSLDESNKIVKKFIIESFNKGYKKLLVVTGKGKNSKSYDNPYVSEKLNVLKYSVPEFIKNNKNLNNKIIKIEKADIRDGGEGAISIFLKSSRKFTE